MVLFPTCFSIVALLSLPYYPAHTYFSLFELELYLRTCIAEEIYIYIWHGESFLSSIYGSKKNYSFSPSSLYSAFYPSPLDLVESNWKSAHAAAAAEKKSSSKDRRMQCVGFPQENIYIYALVCAARDTRRGGRLIGYGEIGDFARVYIYSLFQAWIMLPSRRCRKLPRVL